MSDPKMNGAPPRRERENTDHRARINSQRERTLSLKSANDVLASRQPNGRMSDALALANKHLQTFDALSANRKSEARAMVIALRIAVESMLRALETMT